MPAGSRSGGVGRKDPKEIHETTGEKIAHNRLGLFWPEPVLVCLCPAALVFGALEAAPSLIGPVSADI
jgi:hypothetical protein